MHPKSKGSNCSQKFCDLSIRQKSFCYKRFSELRHKRKKGCGLNLALEKYVSKSSHPEPILPFWKCRLKVQACNWYFNAGGVRQKTVFLSVHYRRLKKNVASISVWFQNIKKKNWGEIRCFLWSGQTFDTGQGLDTGASRKICGKLIIPLQLCNQRKSGLYVLLLHRGWITRQLQLDPRYGLVLFSNKKRRTQWLYFLPQNLLVLTLLWISLSVNEYSQVYWLGRYPSQGLVAEIQANSLVWFKLGSTFRTSWLVTALFLQREKGPTKHRTYRIHNPALYRTQYYVCGAQFYF